MKKLALVLFAALLALLLLGCSAKKYPNAGSLTVTDDTETDAYTRQSASIQTDEKTIRGKFYLPKAEGKKPLVIFCHGFTATYNTMTYLAEQCAEHGMITCAFDFCGGSQNSTSSGKMSNMSAMTEVEDLNIIADTLAKTLSKEEFNGEIYLCGHSQGGYVVTATAAARPDTFKGLVLLAPAYLIDDFVHSSFSSKEDIPSSINATLGYHYFADVWDYDIYEEMAKYTGPVVIFHGDTDGDVPLSYSERAKTTFPNAVLNVVPGMGHMFSTPQFDLFVEAIVEMTASGNNA